MNTVPTKPQVVEKPNMGTRTNVGQTNVGEDKRRTDKRRTDKRRTDKRRIGQT